MFPCWSIAVDPIHLHVVSGWYVLSWKIVTGPDVTPRISNQRTPDTPPALTL
jgi:hypothetical protein